MGLGEFLGGATGSELGPFRDDGNLSGRLTVHGYE